MEGNGGGEQWREIIEGMMKRHVYLALQSVGEGEIFLLDSCACPT